MTFGLNVVVSALVISFASWLSGRFPAAAGFFVALPLASMLVLPLSYQEHGSAESSIVLARSIFIAIPVSLTFFLPFLLLHTVFGRRSLLRVSLGFGLSRGLGFLVFLGSRLLFLGGSLFLLRSRLGLAGRRLLVQSQFALETLISALQILRPAAALLDFISLLTHYFCPPLAEGG